MLIRRRPPSPSVSVKELQFTVNIPNDQPQNILEEIVWYKETEVDAFREKIPLSLLRNKVNQVSYSYDFIASLKNSPHQPALIAEIKKASPSKGVIRENFDPVAIAKSYQEGGASCLSVLTDRRFFQGSFDYLAQVREVVELPLLCKDFIIYPYQIYLARSKGADAILLIAAILSDKDLQYFIKIVKALKMTALIEVHTLAELDRVLGLDGVELIGINNRNLENFTVSLDTTCELLANRISQIQEQSIMVVSESGLYQSTDLQKVSQSGANAVLIGESLMRQDNLVEAIANLYRT